MTKRSTILILGVTGMLGSTLFKSLSQNPSLLVYGTARDKNAKPWFPKQLSSRILTNVNLENDQSVMMALEKVKPDVIINCIGIIKQIAAANDVLQAIPINTLLPRRLAYLSKQVKARLILMSTDCVYSGKSGYYKESDVPDCSDLYGQSKLLGEISDQKHVLTIRTSIIGHELRGGRSLVNWFLKQRGAIQGYNKAIYSGLPTIELARIIQEFILPNHELCGLYHISADPISKYDLLGLIANIYQKKIFLSKSSTPRIDRSLNCMKFKRKTGYKTKPWKQLIQEMHDDFQCNY